MSHLPRLQRRCHRLMAWRRFPGRKCKHWRGLKRVFHGFFCCWHLSIAWSLTNLSPWEMGWFDVSFSGDTLNTLCLRWQRWRHSGVLNMAHLGVWTLHYSKNYQRYRRTNVLNHGVHQERLHEGMLKNIMMISPCAVDYPFHPLCASSTSELIFHAEGRAWHPGPPCSKA